MLKIDGKRVDVDIPDFLDSTKLAAIVEAGAQVAVAQIKNRTRAGIGIDDKPMKTKSKKPNRFGTYAESTSRQRGKEGRNVDVRDLTMTGRMIQGVLVESVQVQVDSATAFVSIANSEKEKAAFNQALTPWFGLSPTDRELVKSTIEQELRKAIASAS